MLFSIDIYDFNIHQILRAVISCGVDQQVGIMYINFAIKTDIPLLS